MKKKNHQKKQVKNCREFILFKVFNKTGACLEFNFKRL